MTLAAKAAGNNLVMLLLAISEPERPVISVKLSRTAKLGSSLVEELDLKKKPILGGFAKTKKE